MWSAKLLILSLTLTYCAVLVRSECECTTEECSEEDKPKVLKWSKCMDDCEVKEGNKDRSVEDSKEGNVKEIKEGNEEENKEGEGEPAAISECEVNCFDEHLNGTLILNVIENHNCPEESASLDTFKPEDDEGRCCVTAWKNLYNCIPNVTVAEIDKNEDVKTVPVENIEG